MGTHYNNVHHTEVHPPVTDTQSLHILKTERDNHWQAMYEMYEMLAVWHAAYYAVNAVFVFPNSDVHHTDRSHYLQTLNSTEQH